MATYLQLSEDAPDLESGETEWLNAQSTLSAVDWWRSWVRRFNGVPSKIYHPKAYQCMVEQWKSCINDPDRQEDFVCLIGHGNGEFDTRGVDMLYHGTPEHLVYYYTPSAPEFDSLFDVLFPEGPISEAGIEYFMRRSRQIDRDAPNIGLFRRIQSSFTASSNPETFQKFIAFLLNHYVDVWTQDWGDTFKPESWNGDFLGRAIQSCMYRSTAPEHLVVPILSNPSDARYDNVIRYLGAAIASSEYSYAQSIVYDQVDPRIPSNKVTLSNHRSFLDGDKYAWTTTKACLYRAYGDAVVPLMDHCHTEATRLQQTGLLSDYTPVQLDDFFHTFMDGFIQQQCGQSLTELSL